MTHTSKQQRTGTSKTLRRNGNGQKHWTIIALTVLGVAVLAVVAWYLFGQVQAETVADHSHSESAEQLAHIHGNGAVELPHIHGMGFSHDGNYLYVAAHDGLRVFTNGEWLVPDLPKHDYMGYSATDQGFYSSGHPSPSSRLVNPLGLVKSTDGGQTVDQLGFAGESDFHVMAVGYYNHAIYVLNPYPNSRLSTGLHYSLDNGKTWQQSALQGLSAQPFAIAVHPTEANVVALATEGGLLFSTDYGNDFASVTTEGEPVTAASFSLDGETLLFGYETLREFELASQQIEDLPVPTLASNDAISYVAGNPVQPDTLAFATFNRHIYLSHDGGENWQQIAEAGQGKDQ